MNTKISPAARASKRISHMLGLRFGLGALSIIGTLCGCAADSPARPPPPPPAAPAVQTSAPGAAAEWRREKSVWQRTSFAELPGWGAERASEIWPALQRSCQRPAPGWERLCAQVTLAAPMNDAATREWLMARLVPYRVSGHDGQAQGLLTGYFEPLVEASRSAQGRFRHPLYRPPADLATRRPHWSRQQLDTLPEAQQALRGREIAFVADPLDALLLQVQGSGRLRLNGGETVRVAFAGHNDLPYRSVGRWLVDQGEMAAAAASWPAIKEWARVNPQRVQEMLWANPRMVFFREEALPDPQLGPRGAQGIALTPGRSIAVDPASVPYGSLIWLDSTEPLTQTPLQRLVLAQDTGGAIQGAVRADYFWGWDGNAEAQAGRMRQVLRLWVLWPLGTAP